MRVTPEMIEALKVIRANAIVRGGKLGDAVNLLDNADVFAAIDDAADAQRTETNGLDPAEWGDLALGLRS